MLDEFIEKIEKLGIKYLKNDGEYVEIRGEKKFIFMDFPIMITHLKSIRQIEKI